MAWTVSLLSLCGWGLPDARATVIQGHGLVQVRLDNGDGHDAYVRAEQPNKGNSWTNHVGEAGGRLDQTYLRFDDIGLLDLDAQYVLSVTLRVYVAQVSHEDKDVTVRGYRVTGPWDEASIVWDTQPSYDGTPLFVDPDNTGTLGWREYDVTSLVQGWLAGDDPNYGILLANEDTCSLGLVASEADGTDPGLPDYTVAHHPLLAITHDTPMPEPGGAELVFLVAAGLALRRKRRPDPERAARPVRSHRR